jgi:hypothetical protein
MTDPDARDALESLYRGSDRSGPALRPFRTALQPPEDTDGYSWLFRPESAAPPAGSTGPSAGSGELADVGTAASAAVRPRRRWLVATLLTAGAVCGALVAAVLRGH